MQRQRNGATTSQPNVARLDRRRLVGRRQLSHALAELLAELLRGLARWGAARDRVEHGAQLVRRLLWVDLAADGGVSERRPPRENLARKSCDVMILGEASSASPRWMGG